MWQEKSNILMMALAIMVMIIIVEGGTASWTL